MCTGDCVRDDIKDSTQTQLIPHTMAKMNPICIAHCASFINQGRNVFPLLCNFAVMHVRDLAHPCPLLPCFGGAKHAALTCSIFRMTVLGPQGSSSSPQILPAAYLYDVFTVCIKNGACPDFWSGSPLWHFLHDSTGANSSGTHRWTWSQNVPVWHLQ